MITRILFVLWVLQTGALALAEEEKALYQNKGTWEKTMIAARDAYQAWGNKQAVRLSPWSATRPLKVKGFSQARFPENGVDLKSKDAKGNPHWTSHPEWTDSQPHNLEKNSDSCATYLFRTISTDRPIQLCANLGSDDGFAIWLNSKLIKKKNVARGVGRDQDQVLLDLKAGENRLLFKIYNRSGGHGFYFSLGADPLKGLLSQLERDFPLEIGAMKSRVSEKACFGWFTGKRNGKWFVKTLMDDLKLLEGRYVTEYKALSEEDDAGSLKLFLTLSKVKDRIRKLESLNFKSLTLALKDLLARFPERYKQGARYLKQVKSHESQLEGLQRDLLLGRSGAHERLNAILNFRKKALLENPLLDFERIIAVKRKAASPKLGLPQNWQGNCSLPRSGYEDRLIYLSLKGEESVFFKPDPPRFMGDLDLHFDGDRMLFSMIGAHNRWQIFEIKTDGTGLRQVTPGEYEDVDNYDACYLPDNRIIFDSSRCFQGIPCVGGADAVANLFIMDANGKNMRQLCFDQDHDWCPTVLNNGRVMYSRWEYSDTPHYFTRILFHMNPDGTGQMEYYGSNSFWPNSLFYARAIPNHPTKFVGIVSGHHGVPRMGELVIFDPALGRREADGVVQRIPGYGKKVTPVIKDQLVNPVWPKFLHPFPLSENYFLTACQMGPDQAWGVYLVDVFDNLVCLAESPGYALFEPLPLKKRRKPPVIPDRVDLTQDQATIYLSNIYEGDGLKGVPKGAVKKLRVYELHYCYNKMGGHIHVGIEGPWDVRRILGVVPVYEDGSAAFTAPANTPLAIQPLDDEGKALTLMRSWFTAMPGEVLSCVGCHESQNSVSQVRITAAARAKPSRIEPWRGPARGFSFKREVQPVLDAHCVKCHDGREGLADLSRKDKNGWGNFTPAYIELHPYVRRPGPESDYRLHNPLEYHADTSELIQMLNKGHHGVVLDQAAMDKLVTWIDLNVPDHGTWGEHKKIPSNFHERRIRMRTLYANRPEDPEIIHEPDPYHPEFAPATPKKEARVVKCEGWPFSSHTAKKRQEDSPLPDRVSLPMGNGISMDFVLIPAGEFLMGRNDACADEAPRTLVRIQEPFYMGVSEVTLEQYHCFDPQHDNGFIDQRHKDHTTPGYGVNGSEHPVIRISWNEAVRFCQWFSTSFKTQAGLPTEAQWEWACRAGADTPFSFGAMDKDYSLFANLADISTRSLAVTGVNPKPIPNPNRYQDYLPKDLKCDDKHRIMAEVKKYQPNPWGLHDMHGNVWEWTLSDYKAYPYQGNDGRNSKSMDSKKVVRGGSWRDRAKRARAGFRLSYRPYQSVYNVGFRIVIKPDSIELVKGQ